MDKQMEGPRDIWIDRCDAEQMGAYEQIYEGLRDIEYQ
jgi:hypothetical protein